MRVEHDFSIQESCQTTAEWQAKTKTLAELVNLHERLKDALLIVGRDATTRICHIEFHETAVQLLTANCDGTLFGELIGIMKQFAQNFQHTLLIGGQADVTIGSLDVHHHLFTIPEQHIAHRLMTKHVGSDHILARDLRHLFEGRGHRPVVDDGGNDIAIVLHVPR